jgi:hypothetical protein
MPVLAKILVNDNSIFPLADGTCGKFMVDHSYDTYWPRYKKEVTVTAARAG